MRMMRKADDIMNEIDELLILLKNMEDAKYPSPPVHRHILIAKIDALMWVLDDERDTL